MACFTCANEFSWCERRSSRIFESEIVRLERDHFKMKRSLH